ncbi:MAG TPA: PQQ-binding-like beta-propeller repeat protein, partial [Pirellula sp.]|nr:PQQ-binding-like beta-propeller repeat protein [Pirellula sp.]
MGPAGLGLLIMLWWLFASRAHWKEKLIGLVAVAIIGFVAITLCHFTMQGMSVVIFLIPYGTAAFAIPLILFANRPSIRLPVALVSAVIGFGYWDLLQTGGVSGKFVADFSWRWESTAEEKYLESLANGVPAKPVETNEAPITLASAVWPNFRGSSRDGKLVGVSLSEDWVASPPKLIWKRPIGPGWSSFSVAGDRIFTQEQRGEKEAVVCLDAKTGSKVWEHEYVSRFWESVAGAGPRATPTISDEGLFSLGANGILTCLNASTGATIWERDLQVDSGRKPPMWGFASPPLVTQGVVIVYAGGSEDKGILAYDAKTGQSRWSIASGDHSYSSAQIASFDSVSGVLMETNAGLQFVNAIDGKKIWQYDSPSKNYRTLQPLVLGNSVLLANSMGEGTKRLSVSLKGDDWSIKEEWASRDMKPDFNDFVEHKGSLYGFDGNIFSCIDLATGKRQWKKGRYGNGQVLMLSDADQMLVTSETGELVLLRADSTSMKELGKFQAIEGKTWNHSVVVGNRVYIRNAEQAACYELPTQ